MFTRGMDWRPALPEALAWALTLAGWLGLTALGQWLAPFQSAAYGPLAAYLAVKGLAAYRLSRAPVPVVVPRYLPAVFAILFLAVAVLVAVTRVPTLGVLAGMLWGLLNTVVVQAEAAGPSRAGRWGALAGALLGGLVLGDLSDGRRILAALAILGLVVAGQAALTRTRRGLAGHLGCMFLPAGGLGPERWPETAATLVMIPMMVALPAMAGLCASAALPVQAMVAAHVLAMFLPAILIEAVAGPLARVSWAAGLLMVLGALPLALGVPDAPYGALAVMLLQGAAWGLVWRAAGGVPYAPGGLAMAVLPAVLAWAAGALARADGVAGFDAMHLALAGLAAAGLLWRAWNRWHGDDGLRTMAGVRT